MPFYNSYQLAEGRRGGGAFGYQTKGLVGLFEILPTATSTVEVGPGARLLSSPPLFSSTEALAPAHVASAPLVQPSPPSTFTSTGGRTAGTGISTTFGGLPLWAWALALVAGVAVVKPKVLGLA
jgi:hypothetical protein